MVPTGLSVGAARIGAAALPADVWLDPFDKRAARRMVAAVPCSAASSLAGALRGSAGAGAVRRVAPRSTAEASLRERLERGDRRRATASALSL